MAPDDPIVAPTGTRDILPPESERFERLLALFGRLAEDAAYRFVLTPIFEELRLFSRGVGTSTDIVTKEMYEFEDRGGRRLALRPEFTASVVRAFVQHRPTLPWKVWYWGPGFRYERPQAGRYRHFYQLGVEALGTDNPELDVEVVKLACDLTSGLGLRSVELLVNSLGDAECRPAYRALLVAHIESQESELCDEHRRQWRDNPLRVLDCKRDECRAVAKGAPAQIDHLCGPCSEHWRRFLAGLDAVGLEARVEPRLVRGLDYYTRTTFELPATRLGTAQNAVGGGGRYDELVATLGGPPTPGIGFSMGIDRLLLACDAEEVFPAPAERLDAFVIDVAGGGDALLLTHALRAAGLSADRDFDGRSMRGQLRAANRSGARVAVIVGPDEVAAGVVVVKDLRGGSEDRRVPRDGVAGAVRAIVG
jgi:histidyl-tRNA synthetase